MFASVAALADALAELAAGYPVMHAQDCISARAACRIRDLRPAGRARDAGSGPFVIRTVHHVDDFTSPALIECQRQAIIEPDKVLVVSEYWRRLLQDQYGAADHAGAANPARCYLAKLD